MLDIRFSHGVSCGQQGECAASLLWQNVFPSRSEGTLLFFFSHEFHITADGQAGCCCWYPDRRGKVRWYWTCLFLLRLCWWYPSTNLHWSAFTFNNNTATFLPLLFTLQNFVCKDVMDFSGNWGLAWKLCGIVIFGLNCLERSFPTPLFAACHLLRGLFLFSAWKRCQFGPPPSGCQEEELLPSCCWGEFPAMS